MDSGTRPGDPLADTTFALIFSEALKELRAYLDGKGMSTWLPLRGKRVFAAQESEEDVRLEEPSFMDDVAILVRSDCPWEVVEM